MKYEIDLKKNIENVFKKNNLNISEINVKKDTNTVKRYMIHYNEAKGDPIKIEISFRNMDYYENKNYNVIKNDIITYPIIHLSRMKIDAFLKRDVARDIFDIGYLLNKYPKTFDNERIIKCYNKINRAGLDFFEKIMKEDNIIMKHDIEKIIINLDSNITKMYNNIKTGNEGNNNIQINKGTKYGY